MVTVFSHYSYPTALSFQSSKSQKSIFISSSVTNDYSHKSVLRAPAKDER